MTTMAPGARTGPRGDRIIFAVILIIVGLGGLASQLFQDQPDPGGWVVMLVGVAFLGGFAYSRRYGLLVPGGIMTGLGAGIALQEAISFPAEAEGGIVVLGLGLGFLSIWVLSSLTRVAGHHPWPLIPGGILSVVGGLLLIGGQAVDLLEYWGAGVVVLGAILLWRAWREDRQRT